MPHTFSTRDYQCFAFATLFILFSYFVVDYPVSHCSLFGSSICFHETRVLYDDIQMLSGELYSEHIHPQDSRTPGEELD
ncbi:hypothetical protein BDV29DRAFT_180329 [Aspergillus leporis]|uniref:Uncharacterized protein n=1 Tax=Aspergillus leporis TaxID=41062 RepID=A0A5N5WU57_9EURO|nr:hypothetical protein BDV29DRAFT_180329 [Aspergillus leporis]